MTGELLTVSDVGECIDEFGNVWSEDVVLLGVVSLVSS